MLVKNGLEYKVESFPIVDLGPNDIFDVFHILSFLMAYFPLLAFRLDTILSVRDVLQIEPGATYPLHPNGITPLRCVSRNSL